jgi:RNA-directed DNA polymerase
MFSSRFSGILSGRASAVDKYGRVYVNFSPAVSRDALKAMRQTIRGWHLQLKSDKNLADLSAMFDPVLRGWQQYYGHFYGSALNPVWRSMNLFLTRWLMRKHKTLAGHKTRASEMLKCLAQRHRTHHYADAQSFGDRVQVLRKIGDQPPSERIEVPLPVAR